MSRRETQPGEASVESILFWKFARKYYGYYVGYIVAVLLAYPLQFVGMPSAMTKLGRNFASSCNTMKPYDGTFSGFFNTDNMVGMTTVIVGGWFFLAAMWMTRESIIRYIAPKHDVHVRSEIYAALVRRYEQEFEEIPSGDIIVRILRIAELYVYKSEWQLQDLIPYSIGFSIFLVYCFYVHWSVGTAVFLGTAVTGVSVACLYKSLLNASDHREETLLRVSQNMDNSFSNLLNIYINNETENEVARGKKWQNEYGESWMSEMQVARNMNLWTMSTTVVTFGIAFWLVVRLMRKKNSVGVPLVQPISGVSLIVIYVIFINWMQSLYLALPQSLKRLGTLQNAMPFLREIFKKSKSEKRTLTSGIRNGSVVFEHVGFAYPKAKKGAAVLRNFSMHIHDKEKVAIVGRSGSGKTTIIKLLLQLYQQQSGTISIGGQDATKLELEYLRNNVNYVNQRTTLHDISIVDNILFGNDHVKKIHVKRLLKKYELVSVFESVGGIDASAGINGTNLSLGMQKCILILRGVFKKGFISVFDEPIAGLDPSTAEKIMRVIQDTCKNKTVICITHKSEIVQKFVNRTIQFSPQNR